jgi:hypothetical protein
MGLKVIIDRRPRLIIVINLLSTDEGYESPRLFSDVDLRDISGRSLPPNEPVCYCGRYKKEASEYADNPSPPYHFFGKVFAYAIVFAFSLLRRLWGLCHLTFSDTIMRIGSLSE